MYAKVVFGFTIKCKFSPALVSENAPPGTPTVWLWLVNGKSDIVAKLDDDVVGCVALKKQWTTWPKKGQKWSKIDQKWPKRGAFHDQSFGIFFNLLPFLWMYPPFVEIFKF